MVGIINKLCISLNVIGFTPSATPSTTPSTTPSIGFLSTCNPSVSSVERTSSAESTISVERICSILPPSCSIGASCAFKYLLNAILSTFVVTASSNCESLYILISRIPPTE